LDAHCCRRGLFAIICWVWWSNLDAIQSTSAEHSKKKDWQSQQGWEDCMAHNSTLPRLLSFWWPWFDLTLQA
jgi:hypothetical protein